MSLENKKPTLKEQFAQILGILVRRRLWPTATKAYVRGLYQFVVVGCNYGSEWELHDYFMRRRNLINVNAQLRSQHFTIQTRP